MNTITGEILQTLDNVRELEKSLRVSVMLPHDEIDRITVNRLIDFYYLANDENKAHLEAIIRAYFLDDDEWEKHVVNGVAL